MRSVLLSSYAKLPTNTTAQKLYDQLVLVAVVDLDEGKILEADCSMVTELARRYVGQLLVGYDLKNSVEPLLGEIELRYFGHLKKALLTAVKMLGAQYLELSA